MSPPSVVAPEDVQEAAEAGSSAGAVLVAAPGGASAARAGMEDRIVAAALVCIGRFGVAKTSLEDVARQAGCSRASVYRAFPGGKEPLLEAVVVAELGRFFAELNAALDRAGSLEELLVDGVTTAGRWIVEHRALQFVLAHEPEVVLPLVSFSEMDHLLSLVSDVVAPHLEAWIDPVGAARVVEWTTRLVLSYAASPSPYVDVRDRESVRSLLRTFVLPGIQARGWAYAEDMASAR
jgi:AcrR family transcriptional regulator